MMKLMDIIKGFKNKRILVIGDLMLDGYIWGRVSRISPEAPVPVVDVVNDTFMLGGAANVANNIAALGGGATVIGVAGMDRQGDVLEGLLEEKAIGFSIVREARPTTVKTRVIAHNQQIVRFDKEYKEKIGGRTLKAVLEKIREAVPGHDAVIISDYKKGLISKELMKWVLAFAKGKFIAVDPKVGHFHLYKNVSLITPNIMEASSGSGIEIKDERSLLKSGAILKRKLNLKAVLITRGEEGMTLFEGNEYINIPTVARHVYDITGAGDTVIAVFSLAHASGATLRESAEIANHAAGIVVGEVGTAVATPEKLRKSLSSRRNAA
jgi:D-beta-D-heptose 7-phosphate kinase/D-beta-D-heptose 1-phosphate adenosyltransferase